MAGACQREKQAVQLLPEAASEKPGEPSLASPRQSWQKHHPREYMAVAQMLKPEDLQDFLGWGQ